MNSLLTNILRFIVIWIKRCSGYACIVEDCHDCYTYPGGHK